MPKPRVWWKTIGEEEWDRILGGVMASGQTVNVRTATQSWTTIDLNQIPRHGFRGLNVFACPHPGCGHHATRRDEVGGHWRDVRHRGTYNPASDPTTSTWRMPGGLQAPARSVPQPIPVTASSAGQQPFAPVPGLVQSPGLSSVSPPTGPLLLPWLPAVFLPPASTPTSHLSDLPPFNFGTAFASFGGHPPTVSSATTSAAPSGLSEAERAILEARYPPLG